MITGVPGRASVSFLATAFPQGSLILWDLREPASLHSYTSLCSLTFFLVQPPSPTPPPSLPSAPQSQGRTKCVHCHVTFSDILVLPASWAQYNGATLLTKSLVPSRSLLTSPNLPPRYVACSDDNSGCLFWHTPDPELESLRPPLNAFLHAWLSAC